MSTPCPAALRGIALEAARGVAPALAAAFRTPGTAAETKTNHHDLVTVHDRATEEALVAALTTAVPGSTVLGEETGCTGAEGRTGADGPGVVRWIVDPIDGTSNFSHGFAMFSVSVAAEVHGQVVAGVVLSPVDGLEFSADSTGAWLGRIPLPRRPAPAGGERSLNLVTSYPAAEALDREGPSAAERFAHLVQAHATVRRTVSGALELAYVAAGWADVALLVDTNPWDVAAGQLLVARAGGTLVGADDAGPAPDTPAHLARHLLAVGPGRRAPTAAAVLTELTRVRASTGPRGTMAGTGAVPGATGPITDPGRPR
ncbi:inositol monophosphatase [Micrococcus sp.]|uniref:inositol monophosphatase family protein n=1 Tax=Micrococcus sp. TaxID=1271 RepID=UPI002A90E342|nr:inositol monophosphatase [Micrococcus sp.]MDY6055749.1 inositol monophosphatase [Micrococcus sp.]